jgi:hypothetical protein
MQPIPEDHEIASHAVGHWNGGFVECEINPETRRCAKDDAGNTVWRFDLRWTKADWKLELDQFYAILDKAFDLNGLVKPRGGIQFRNDIVGFRAPQLGFSPGLYEALPAYNIQYDTSQISTMDYWPQRNYKGIWNFPLARLREPGTGRMIPSMDYNFCAMDSLKLVAENPDLLKVSITTESGKVRRNQADCLSYVDTDIKNRMQKKMRTMYLQYFANNYYGNRAPVHIGHHFSKWMGGAYYDAFLEFADQVCGLPEVKCVTYKELMSFLNNTPQSEQLAYKLGRFPQMPRTQNGVTLQIAGLAAEKTYDLDLSVEFSDKDIKANLTGKDIAKTGASLVYRFDGITVKKPSISFDEIRSQVKSGTDVRLQAAVVDKNGKTLKTETYRLENVGTTQENLSPVALEDYYAAGHLPNAHDLSITDTEEMMSGH